MQKMRRLRPIFCMLWRAVPLKWRILGYVRSPFSTLRPKGDYDFFFASFFFKKKKNAREKKIEKNRKNAVSKISISSIDFRSIFDQKMSHFWPPFLDPFWTPILDPILRVLTSLSSWVLLIGAEIRDFRRRDLRHPILGPKMGPKWVIFGSKNGPKWQNLRVKTRNFGPKPENPENGHFGVQNHWFWVILGSKMGQNRSFWVILGSKITDFGSFLGPKCDFPQNAIFDVFFAKKRSILHFLRSRDRFWVRFLKVLNRSRTPKSRVYPTKRCIFLILV